MAGAASTESFLMFAQVTTAVGVLVIVYWLIARPGTYEPADAPAVRQ